MHSAHAASAKKLDGLTIKTTVQTILTAEFAPAISEDPSAFESGDLSKEHIAFDHP